MTTLTICNEDNPQQTEIFRNYDEIVRQLDAAGVLLEKWQADQELDSDATPDNVIAAYQASIDKLKHKYAFKSVDVVSLRPDHPQKDEFRQKFLAEHTHDDFEIRFFVDGCGLFYLHIGDKVYMVVCESGDLISVPANTTHWFDMGKKPNFKCIRFFTTEEGWLADFTGNEIARSFPDYDEHLASLR